MSNPNSEKIALNSRTISENHTMNSIVSESNGLNLTDISNGTLMGSSNPINAPLSPTGRARRRGRPRTRTRIISRPAAPPLIPPRILPRFRPPAPPINRNIPRPSVPQFPRQQFRRVTIPRNLRRRRNIIARVNRWLIPGNYEIVDGRRVFYEQVNTRLSNGLIFNYHEFEILPSFTLNDPVVRPVFTNLMRGILNRANITNSIGRNNVRTQLMVMGQSYDSSGVGTERFFSVPIAPYLDVNDLISTLWSNQLNRIVQTYQDFMVEKIIFGTAMTSRRILGSNSRSITQADKTWYILDPKSKFNCVFQCICTIKNFHTDKELLLYTDEGQKKRVNKAKSLKKKIKRKYDIPDCYADIETLQQVANYLRYPIVLYNNVFKIIRTFNPEKPLKRYKMALKKFELQKVGDHCKALIRKKLILKSYPDFKFPGIAVKKAKVMIQKNELIKKPCNFNKKPFRIAAYDLETFNEEETNYKHIPYALGFCYRKLIGINTKSKKYTNSKGENKEYKWEEPVYGELIEKQWWGLDCCYQFVEWLSKNMKKLAGYTLYAHNGGKYDIPLLLEDALINTDKFTLLPKKCIELNGSWIGLSVRSSTNRNQVLNFRDSFRMFSVSLEKITKDFKVKHQKLKELVDHSEVTRYNFYELKPQISKYLEHDTKGLLECLEKFNEFVWKNMKIDITSCLTGASLSKKDFYYNYYDPKKYPLYTLKDEIDKELRIGFCGGKVGCKRLGLIPGNKFYYLDFTSMYPDQGRKALPYGNPELNIFIDTENSIFSRLPTDILDNISGFVTTNLHLYNRQLPKNFKGFVTCYAKHKQSSIDKIMNMKEEPLHCLKKNSRLIFPICKNWVLFNGLAVTELNFERYDYRFIKGYKFEYAPYLRKFFNNGFNAKRRAKKQGKKGLAHTHKIKINSGFGHFGLRVHNRDGIIIEDCDGVECIKALNEGRLKGCREINNSYCISRVEKNLEIKSYNVAVTSQITSYSRMRLIELIESIYKVGGEVYNFDTDSIITNVNISNYPEIYHKFKFDGTGEELGSLKNEAEDLLYDNGYTYEQVEELKKKHNGEIHFNELAVNMCKGYGLRLDPGDGKVLEINKLKGFQQKEKLINGKRVRQKIQFNHHKKIANGEVINQKQNQFRLPKNNYISETDSFAINTKFIGKSFRQVYDKGNVNPETKWITPLEL